MAAIEDVAFPRLTEAEFNLLKPLASMRDYDDSETVFNAGQAEIDLFFVESGGVDIFNPSD
jgi:hypothetical protein